MKYSKQDRITLTILHGRPVLDSSSFLNRYLNISKESMAVHAGFSFIFEEESRRRHYIKVVDKFLVLIMYKYDVLESVIFFDRNYFVETVPNFREVVPFEIPQSYTAEEFKNLKIPSVILMNRLWSEAKRSNYNNFGEILNNIWKLNNGNKRWVNLYSDGNMFVFFWRECYYPSKRIENRFEVLKIDDKSSIESFTLPGYILSAVINFGGD